MAMVTTMITVENVWTTTEFITPIRTIPTAIAFRIVCKTAPFVHWTVRFIGIVKNIREIFEKAVTNLTECYVELTWLTLKSMMDIFISTTTFRSKLIIFITFVITMDLKWFFTFTSSLRVKQSFEEILGIIFSPFQLQLNYRTKFSLLIFRKAKIFFYTGC